MKRTILVAGVLLAVTNVASAELIQSINIDFVTIGNPGNPGDTRTEYPDKANPHGCGAVDYVYQIGKYEVTNAQWYDFVSAAGAPTGNPSNAYDESAFWTGDNIPATYVSWLEAAQFCNYLTSGDKSQGAYQFSGNNSNAGDFEGINRDSAVSTYGIIYVLPTEDEWYKAAYYTGTGYSTYATKDGESLTQGDGISGTGWNYWDDGYATDPHGPWAVGSGSEELNGTFDMMGNIWERNETLIGSYRGTRGGSYDPIARYIGCMSSVRGRSDPFVGISGNVGFRVAAVPEPCSLVLLSLGGLGLVCRRRSC
jgi:formylglycine-generating enzyme required for sulfatase activity